MLECARRERGKLLGGYLARLAARRDLLWQLTLRSIKGQRKQSLLGAFWVVLQPLGLLIVMALLFSKRGFLGGAVELGRMRYVLFAMAGLVPWTFFSAAFTNGVAAVADNANLVRKIAFPRVVLPLSVILSSFVNLLAASALFAFLCVLYGHAPGAGVLWAPVILAIETVLLAGLLLGCSAINVFVRDIRHTIPFLTMLLLFVTPIFYPEHLAAKRFGAHAWLLHLNPLHSIVASFRLAVLGGRVAPGGAAGGGLEWVAAPVDPVTLAWAAASALAVFVLGYAVFRKTEPYFADVV